MQIALKAVKQNKRPKHIKYCRKISKTDQKPPNLHKTNFHKTKLTTWNLQFSSERAQIQYNIIIKPHKQENCKKLLLKAARNKKISLAQRKFFHTSISRSLENSDMNKKPLSFRFVLQFVQQQNHSKFFTRFNSRFKIHSNKID